MMWKKRKAPEKIRQVGLCLVKSWFNGLSVKARCVQVTALPRIPRPMAWSGKQLCIWHQEFGLIIIHALPIIWSGTHGMDPVPVTAF